LENSWRVMKYDMNRSWFGLTREYEIKHRKLELRQELELAANVTEDRLAEIEAELKALEAEEERIGGAAARLDAVRSGTAHTRTVATFSPGAATSAGGTGLPVCRDDKPIMLGKEQRMADRYPNAAGLSLGRYVRGIVTGDWTGAAAESAEYRSLTTVSGAALIPQVLSAQVLDAVRAKSVLFQSGASMVPMEARTVVIPRVKTDPVFGFKAEAEACDESIIEFEGVELKAKTAYGLVSVSLEALESGQGLDMAVQLAMAEALANVIDSKCLFGAGGVEPAGILLSDKIGAVTAVGDLQGWSPFIEGIGKVRTANGDPTALVMNAQVDELCNKFTTTEGLPLPMPKVIENIPNKLISNQLPANLGAGANESVAMVYDPQAVVIGIQSPIRIELSREALDAYKKGVVYLRVYAFCDVALTRPGWVCRIDGLK
jgi:HK97 family phage major capsid protein